VHPVALFAGATKRRPRRSSVWLAPYISGDLTPLSERYKRKIAIPTRMMMMMAIAYLISLVNPIHVRRCRSSSGSIAVIPFPAC
jgi:hypothetical protein